MLEFVVPTIETSSIDFLTGLVHRHYHRPTGDAALAVESEKGKLEIFTELNPWFLIHAPNEETIICRKDPFQITSTSTSTSTSSFEHKQSRIL